MSVFGFMASQQQQPPSECRHFAEVLWVAERDLADDGGFLVTPDRFADLLFFGGRAYIMKGQRRERLTPMVILGPLTRPVRLSSAGRIRCAGIRLQAWAAAGLLDSSARFPGEWCDARWVAASAGKDVIAKLRTGSAAGVVLAALRSVLVNQLVARLGIAGVAAAGAALTPPDAALTTAQLCERLGVGRRQAERRFRSSTRVSPKQFAGVARFQLVRDGIWNHPAQSLASLAVAAGYADQPHMTREFRRYAGVTPRQFAQWCLRGGPG